MTEITDIMNKYKECVRSLWNNFFLDQMRECKDWDIRDEYDDICVLLFTSLVLMKLDVDALKKSPGYAPNQDPIHQIKVVPSSENGISVLINRGINTGYWDYPLKAITPNDADMRFIDYFDFDKTAFCNLQYILVRIISSDMYPDIIGRNALIQCESAKIYAILENSKK